MLLRMLLSAIGRKSPKRRRKTLLLDRKANLPRKADHKDLFAWVMANARKRPGTTVSSSLSPIPLYLSRTPRPLPEVQLFAPRPASVKLMVSALPDNSTQFDNSPRPPIEEQRAYGIDAKNGIYLQFESEPNFELKFESLEAQVRRDRTSGGTAT